jgi:hypothetical protein
VEFGASYKARPSSEGETIRYVPNILTILRIACAALLPLTRPFSVAFFALYAFCGLSDILDGAIARKYRCASSLGAALDSIADFLFIAAALFTLIPALPWETWMLAWACAIAGVRFLSLGTGWYKFRTLAFLHTVGNKATGAVLYLVPLLVPLAGLKVPVAIACILASLSAMEEFVIMIGSASLDRNVPGLWKLKRG